jgi:hypothetical protein
MTAHFRRGDKVQLSDAGMENEGYATIAGKTLTVAHVATAYMPAKEFYVQGQPRGFHPGFDKSAGCALYDLTVDGKSCPFSLYEWELTAV